MTAGVRRVTASTTTVDARVRHILRLVERGQWRPGKSHRLLAERWKVAEASLRDMVSEAFRHRRLSLGKEAHEDLERQLAKLEHIIEVAMHMKRALVVKDKIVYVDAPDVRGAVKAVETYLRACGLMIHGSIRHDTPKGSLDELRQKRDLARHAIERLDDAIEDAEERKQEMH
jgi:hypothetical protein